MYRPQSAWLIWELSTVLLFLWQGRVCAVGGCGRRLVGGGTPTPDMRLSQVQSSNDCLLRAATCRALGRGLPLRWGEGPGLGRSQRGGGGPAVCCWLPPAVAVHVSAPVFLCSRWPPRPLPWSPTTAFRPGPAGVSPRDRPGQGLLSLRARAVQ